MGWAIHRSMFSSPPEKNFDPSNCLCHILDNPVLSWFYCFSRAAYLFKKTQRGQGGTSMVVPAWIIPHPMSRQCFSTRRLNAIFSPLLVQTGEVSCNFAKSFFTAITRAPDDMDPMFNIRISPFVSFDTFPCFAEPYVLTPISRLKRKKFTYTKRTEKSTISISTNTVLVGIIRQLNLKPIYKHKSTW